MYFEVVQTIAEVAGALTGFVGVVFVLGKRADRKLSPKERNGLFHLLVGSVGTLMLSILVMLLLALMEMDALAWRVSSGMIAVYIMFGATNAIREELSGVHSLPKPFNWALPITSQVIALFNVSTALGVAPELSALSCVLGLLVGLVVAITYFISLLTGHYETEDA